VAFTWLKADLMFGGGACWWTDADGDDVPVPCLADVAFYKYIF
jgi:hypothetical protein